MHGCIGRPQEAGYNWCGSGIHRLAPLRFGHSGGLPLVAEINGEGRTAGGSDRVGGAEIVTPWCGSFVPEQLAVSAVHHAARFGDQPEHVPPFARSLPDRTDKRAMAPKDKAKGEVARGGTSLQRIVNLQELGMARALVSGRHEFPIRHQTVAVYRPVEAGRSGKPDGCTLIMEDNQTFGTHGWHGAQAKAKPSNSLCDDHVVFAIGNCFRQWLTVGRK